MKTLTILALMFVSLPALADGLTPAQATALSAALNTVCPLIEQEALELQIIAEERANPAGVIDLRRRATRRERDRPTTMPGMRQGFFTGHP